MRYLPISPSDRAQMLRDLGLRSVDELFASIPAEARLKRDLKLPPAMSEREILE